MPELSALNMNSRLTWKRVNDVAWLLLLFIAPTIPYLDPSFPPSREAIQEQHPEAIRGVHAAAAASASVGPAREARSFVNECKK